MKTGDKAYSTCGEVFNYDSPDFDAGDFYYEGTVQEILPSRLVSKWTVDTILEQMDERLYEVCGELAEESLDMSDENKEELLCLIKSFVDKHANISCYTVVDVVEKIME
jgi:hypothetical protein